MRHKKVKLSALLLFGLGLTGLFAQEAIPASGGNTSGSGGSVSYSIGQVLYSTYTGSNGSVANGVQQPYEISIVTGLEEAKGFTLKCLVYPIPANDYLKLKVENCKIENLTYQLYDMNGKLLKSKKVTGEETVLDLNNLIPATYFLEVTHNEKEIKTFKIIKN